MAGVPSGEQLLYSDQSFAEGRSRCVLAEVEGSVGRDLDPANPAARPILEQAARQLGVPVRAVATAPKGEALKLNPIRVGLYDQYGGLMPSGWIRWLFENYEVPFQVVYPQTLDAGDLKSKFDVLVFSDG